MKTIIVDLKSYFDRSISTRVAVQNLFRFDKRDIEEVVVDFSEIHFVSSSASHQFYLEVKALEKDNIKVTVINVLSDVDRMLELAKTDRKNIFTIQDVKHFDITSDKDLSELLLQV
jgi:anti-anti-sigma regulatory factor